MLNIPCEETPPENIALYEGEQNTLIRFTGPSGGVKWSTLATTDELTEVDIVNYDDTVAAGYTVDYSFDPRSGLTILNATSTADYTDHQLSTSGLYSVQCGGSYYSFKVLVVRKLSD